MDQRGGEGHGEELSEWKERVRSAFSGLKKVTSNGLKKSEQFSRVAKHKVKRGLLLHERSKLYQELGGIAFSLLDAKKIEHPDLDRVHEQIERINLSIEEEAAALEELKTESEELE